MDTAQRKSGIAVFLLAFMIMMNLVPSAFVRAENGDGIVRTYGDTVFTKVSNPNSGPGQADGINTNDLTGFPPNRLNSYAWAVETLGNAVYIGTNRTLFGSAMNAYLSAMPQNAQNAQYVRTAVENMTNGEVPVTLEDRDYIPQIIKFDVENGKTKVIYRPSVAERGGKLYYTDQNGEIIQDADVTTETASFRSVVRFRNNLYFGSLGVHMLEIVRIDENDHAEIVYEAHGHVSSLRAACVHDSGDGETVYVGGQDDQYPLWIQDNQRPSLPIVIRRLDPDTAGTDHEDWSGLVADFRDFRKYANATVYNEGGGNVWDLCSFNGRLYLILAHDDGWVMFRGEQGGASPNSFGWTWTEIVGENGRYPQAMDPEIKELNQKYAADNFSGGNVNEHLTGTGLLDSAATPYVYKGKMYIGTFDNATMLQSQTFIKIMLQSAGTAAGGNQLTYSQIYAPIYYALDHPQRIWCMDENENIRPVQSANALLEGTTNDYVWRFIEYDGKLYAGTFDASTAYNYFLNPPSMSGESSATKPVTEPNNPLLNGILNRIGNQNIDNLRTAINSISNLSTVIPGTNLSGEDAERLNQLTSFLNKVLQGNASIDEFLDIFPNLGPVLDRFESVLNNLEANPPSQIPAGLITAGKNLINALRPYSEEDEGIEYLRSARDLALNAEKGFDILVTEDGVNWKKVVGDGLGDSYNYGARTFAVLGKDLYLGTANPYFGAQLWKISGKESEDSRFVESVDYRFVEGDGSSWFRSSGILLPFRIKNMVDDSGTYAKFTGILINGNKVADTQYRHYPGSVIVDLKPTYLETLPLGEHSIRAEFSDGAAEAKFTTVEQQSEINLPDTGDKERPMLYVCIGLIALAGLILLAVRKRK